MGEPRHTHHHYGDGHSARRSLSWALAITVGFAVVEALGGTWAGSLALVSDAGHMFTDAFSLALALAAAWIARRPPSRRHSYGLVRAEIVAALANGLLMLGIVFFILVEAIDRLKNPRPVAGQWVMGIAAVGLAVNLGVAWVLSRGGKNLNTRAALLHVFGDLLGSVAALAAGVIVYFTGWWLADPLLSLVVVSLLLVSTVRLTREALHVLMEGVPEFLDLEAVGRAMAATPGVLSVHDLHIWTLGADRVALSAHVDVADLAQWPGVLGELKKLLAQRFGIDHVTLQPEIGMRVPQGKVLPLRPAGGSSQEHRS